jgi:hypothetical protein
MISSPSATKGTNNGVFVDGLPDREGLTAAFFTQELRLGIREKGLLSSTGGGGREPPNLLMYAATKRLEAA